VAVALAGLEAAVITRLQSSTLGGHLESSH